MKTTKRNTFGKNQTSTLSTYKAVLSVSYKELIEKGNNKDFKINYSPINYGEYSFIGVWYKDNDPANCLELSPTISTDNLEEVKEWEVECDNKDILDNFLSYFPGNNMINTITYSVGDKIKIRPKYEGHTRGCLYKGKFDLPAAGMCGMRYSVKGDNPIGKEGIIVELKEANKGKTTYNTIVEFPNLVLPISINRLEKINN